MKELYLLIRSDLYRIVGSNKNWLGILINFYKPEFSYFFWLRFTRNYYLKGSKFCFFLSKYLLRPYTIKYDYEIPYQCRIDFGLRLMHLGGVIVDPLATIWRNVTLLRGFTVGSNIRGKRKGAPTIGNDVFIGANAAIIGKVMIGNDVMVAPNTFINFDVPAHSICFGNPGKVVHKKYATEFYIDNPF
jgi:serine O-acetyltransferase